MNAIASMLKPVASLRLTVVLFAMAMVLILAGTLAQVDEGIWTVVARYFRSGLVWIEFRLFIPPTWVPQGSKVPGGFPFPGGLAIGAALFVNLIAAHVTRFKFTWKRAGIIVSHLGVLLLLVGEFVTGAFAEEGNMGIDEGQSSNYVEDIRKVELAIIDPSDPASDRHIIVPQRFLERAAPGARISNGLLPFEIQVDRWMLNSRILGPAQVRSAGVSFTDSGFGKELGAVPQPPVSGVDGQTIDVPSAYITLFKGEQRLGSYLVSLHVAETQDVAVPGDKTYKMELRFKRTYKPYTITLNDFKHDRFVGTDTARNFESVVRLQDPERNVDREVRIWMNNPLRYRGETFYQASFKQGDGGTVLQVVRNPGWLLPYVSCAMVSIGVLWHFGIRLSQGSQRSRKVKA